MKNKELLEKVADKIETHPDLWDQGLFGTGPDCGTAHCIGGWAAVLVGKNPNALLSWEMGELLGFDEEEVDFVFYNGFNHSTYEWAHKEVAEWLRAIARGANVRETAPEWWAVE